MMQSKTPLISVLICAYNHEQYIKECIMSIVDQTYSNLELLILDDGSSDTTYDVISSLKDVCKKRFIKFYYAKQANKGIIETFNTLLSLSEGDYIYLIASDDIAKYDAIETLYSYYDDGTVLVVGNNEIIDKNSNKVAWNEKQEIVKLGSGFDTFWDFLTSRRPELKDLTQFGSYESIIRGNYITNGYLLRKSAVVNIGGYNHNAPLEDFYLNIQLSKLGKFKFINKILFSYRWHDSNTIKNPKMAIYGKQTLLYEEHLLKKNNDIKRLNIFREVTTRLKQYNVLPFVTIIKEKNLHSKSFYIKLGKNKIKLLQYKLN